MTNLFKIPCLDNHKGKITGEIILKTYNYICTEIFKNEKGSHRRKEIELRFIIEVENGLFFPLFEQGNEYFKDWVVNANNDSLSNDFSEDDYAQSMIDVYINLSEDIYGNDKGEKSSAKDEFSRISNLPPGNIKAS